MARTAGMSSEGLRRRRRNLMRADPHCHWCGIEVVWFKIPRNTTTPPNFATLDHLNTRLTYPDQRPILGQIVLACHACNSLRNDAEQASTPLEELRRRAHRYPRTFAT